MQDLCNERRLEFHEVVDSKVAVEETCDCAAFGSGAQNHSRLYCSEPVRLAMRW